ncbi:MAG: bifunctional 3-(3-hydroxy-phenyl)propionate/3-hydroxycinnamic acid hydroxylase [Rubrivivax sp.]
MQDITLPAVDVLIVGYGPVGATLANLLGRHGVRTLVVDKATEIFKAPRAIALDNEALRILQMAGLEEGAIDTVAIPAVHMRSPLFGNYARIAAAGQIDGHPKLVTFYQPQLEAVLRERLAKVACVQAMTGTELLAFEPQPDGVAVRLKLADGATARVAARFLVGADGANSKVRQDLGLSFGGRTFAQDWLVVDAQRVPDPIRDIEFICDPARPVPHMVAPGDRQRWEFMLRPGETREQMERPETVRRLLAPWARTEDIHIERVAVYRFHARVADRFSQGRVFLVGDAAHITPPFAGQGLVAGLRDVANLSWKLAWVAQGRADERILDSYDTERRPHAKAIINLALFMGKLVMPSNRVAAFLTHGLMRTLGLVPRLRRVFEELEIKPQNRFGQGLFAPRERGARLDRGGLLPQGWVRSTKDGRIVLSDDAIGPRLALIGFGVDAEAGLAPELRTAWRAAGGSALRVVPRGRPADTPADAWEDLHGTLLPGAAPVGWVAVVRPDRTVLVDGPATDAAAIMTRALALLGSEAPAPAGMPSRIGAHAA